MTTSVAGHLCDSLLCAGHTRLHVMAQASLEAVDRAQCGARPAERRGHGCSAWRVTLLLMRHLQLVVHQVCCAHSLTNMALSPLLQQLGRPATSDMFLAIDCVCDSDCTLSCSSTLNHRMLWRFTLAACMMCLMLRCRQADACTLPVFTYMRQMTAGRQGECLCSVPAHRSKLHRSRTCTTTLAAEFAQALPEGV